MSETPNHHRRSSSETPNRVQRRPSQIVFGSFSAMPTDVFYDSTFDEAPPSKVARVSPRHVFYQAPPSNVARVSPPPLAPPAPAGAFENVAKDDEKPKNAKA
ncbi:hypothetical protein Gohar_022321 [Gossypium harknessii]|uniref:Uncharacterized protein n=1 Tax=Gossypium harknessii TaxID=34285 RepID=A0A7J9IBQ4_9ROSI|nr:hypothetical protein [Gossypium harknessii]